MQGKKQAPVRALFLSIGLLLSAFIGHVQAAPRSLKTAQKAAQAFLGERNGRTIGELKRVELSNDIYIFNSEEDRQFVILSASDRMRPVIGYGDGNIEAESLATETPENTNFLSWMKMVQRATEYLESHPEAALTEAQRSTTTTPISPLLGNIRWDQGEPFNNLCPTYTEQGVTSRSVTGCVATAMAQCVYYHRYPAQGQGGTYRYQDPNSGDYRAVNFSTQSYNYDLMFDQYTGRQSAAQIQEVARLSYHCGVMVNMAYGASSGASELRIRRGLVENLDYDPLCQTLYRAYYSFDEWNALMQEELAQKRPVIYCGTAMETIGGEGPVGHCFVIDGINSQGLYHVNWGWNGSFDGYYDICVLNPEGVSTGAVMSYDGFSYYQTALVQLAPRGEVRNGRYISEVLASEGISISGTSFTNGSPIKVSLGYLYNTSTDSISGDVGMAWVRNGRTVVHTKFANSRISLSGLSADGEISADLFSRRIHLPSNIASGKYQVYLTFTPNYGTFKDSTAYIRMVALSQSYLDCEVSGTNFSFDLKTYNPNLTVTDWSHASDTLPAATNVTITCQVTNEDPSVTFPGRYYLGLYDKNGQTTYVEADKVLTLAPGETGRLSFRHNFKVAGHWESSLYVVRQNIMTADEKEYVGGTYRSFTVYTENLPEFKLEASPTLIGERCVVGQGATFRLNLSNTGSDYSGAIQIQFFRSTTSTTVLGTLTAEVEVPATAGQGIDVTGIITKTSEQMKPAASGTAYYARAYYYSGGQYKAFAVATNVSNRAKVTFYPADSANGIERVVATNDASPADAISAAATGSSAANIASNAKIYDLMGKPVKPNDGTLRPGIYIVDGKKIVIRK